MFEQRFFLWLLWLIPLLGLLAHHAYKKKHAAAQRFLEPAMQRRLMPRFDGVRTFSRAAVYLLALSLILIAAAGPMFGIYFEEVRRTGADVYVLLDVSRSMLAEDVAPNRLQRAKSDIKDLLQRVVGERVGLIVFAGKPVVQVPLTTDHGFFNEMLDLVDTNSAPRGGTAIGDAIRRALESMPERSDREQGIVLITDGEDQDSMPLDAARDAVQRNVRILTVGLGDAELGAPIPIRDARGNSAYLEHDGRQVFSKVDEQTLREIAQLTGGVYIPAGTRAFDLGQIYLDYLARLKGGDERVEQRKKHRLQYQIFLAAGVLLLLVYLSVPEYREGPVRT